MCVPNQILPCSPAAWRRRCYAAPVQSLVLLVAVLVIIGLFLLGGVFRYLRQELQDTPEERRRRRR
jgi:hypothetical protein